MQAETVVAVAARVVALTVHYESVYGGEDFVVSSDLPE